MLSPSIEPPNGRDVSKSSAVSETSFLLPEIEDNDDDGIDDGIGVDGDTKEGDGDDAKDVANTAESKVNEVGITIKIGDNDDNDNNDELRPLSPSETSPSPPANTHSYIDGGVRKLPLMASGEADEGRSHSRSLGSLQREPSMRQLPTHSLSINSAIALYQSHREEGLTATQVLRKQKISGPNSRVRVRSSDTCCGCGCFSTSMLGPVVASTSRVIRDGAVAEVSTRALVPGDLIVLTAGRVVPADVRLITVTDFQIDNALFAEDAEQPVLVTCSVESEEPKCKPANAACLALCGAVVVQGEAKGIVSHIGKDTHVARKLYDLRKLERRG